jgi:hypothetical protein
MGCLATHAVPDPRPRPTRTDPGPEGHVRRESREAWGGEGGGRAASLEPSAGAFALSEPDSRWAMARVLSSRVVSPGLRCLLFLRRHFSAMPLGHCIEMGVPKYF